MPKLILLKNRKDFERLRRAKTIQSSFFRLKWVEELNQNQPRFGFIIPKNVIKKVTDRNKVKRRLKGILQKEQQHLIPSDILIFPNASTLKLKFKILEGELISLLKRAKLWHF